MPAYNGGEPAALLRDRLMKTMPQFGGNLMQFRSHGVRIVQRLSMNLRSSRVRRYA